MEEITLIGCVQAIFLSTIILFKRNKKTQDYILFFFVFLIGMKLLNMHGGYNNWSKTFPYIVMGDILYWLLLGPLLFVYVKTVTSGKQKLPAKYLFHLLPLVFVLTSFSDYLINHINESMNSYLSESGKLFPRIGLNVFFLVSPFYYVWSIIILFKHRKAVSNFFSTKKEVDFKWLFYITNGFATYLLFGLISIFLQNFFNIDLSFNIYQYSSLFLVIYIFGLGYIGLYRKTVLFGFEEFMDSISKSRYEKSAMTQAEAETLINKLYELMNEEKLYLDCQLNLQTLANSLKTNTHKLSQSLNEFLGESFFDFINKYRIEEVKVRMADPDSDKYKIIAIAYDCGFNSKSAFYKCFRKNTGITPSEYMRTVSEMSA